MAKKLIILLGREKQITRSALGFILIFAIAVGFISVEYYKGLKSVRVAESSSYLQEISKQMEANAQRIMEDNYAILETIAVVLTHYDNASADTVQRVVAEQKRLWGFEDIMAVDESGIIYSSVGKQLALPNNDYLNKIVVERQSTMASAQVIDGVEYIVFAIPMNGVTVAGTPFVALCASYTLDTFERVISTSAFDGRAYTHIIDATGSTVVRSTSPYAESFGYNLLRYLDAAVIKNDKALQQMNQDIPNGKAGTVICDVNGVEKYISYYPLSASDWCLITFVPAAVANEKSNLMIQFSAIFCITIAVVMVLLMLLLIVSFLRHKRRIERIAFVDPVTDGNTLQRFQMICEQILIGRAHQKFAMTYINIEKFKVINEQFGRSTGDCILKTLNAALLKNLDGTSECVARVMADHFCCMVEYETEEQLVKRFQLWRSDIEGGLMEQGLEIVLPTMQFGVYVINVPTMSIPFIIDRAKLSLSEKTNNYHSKIHYAVYDERKRDQLFREKQLEDRMEQALSNGEFEVYLQPKVIPSTRKIAGAEALIRWNAPDGTMIYPDEFIPLFERNGFIVQTDLWVFDQVCATLQRWQDAGYPLMPISINCSRMNLNRSDYIQCYGTIFEKYTVPPQFIEVELTESVVYEDVERLLDIIAQLHALGFSCSMDDFGSGYSSLNMIQDIPVDVLKLDKIFFRNTKENNDRAQSVISGIVRMAKALNMKTVAEGVELEEQVVMLAGMDCDLIQGYVFARPMPIASFEELAEFTS